MTQGSSNDQINLEIELSDQQVADDVQQWLKDNKIKYEPPPHAIVPIIPIVIGAALGAAAIAALVEYIRRTHACQQTIDARRTPVVTKTDCSVRNGRVIVITKDNQKVEIHDVPQIFDFTKVAKAALSGAADAVKKAAELAGAKTTVGPATS